MTIKEKCTLAEEDIKKGMTAKEAAEKQGVSVQSIYTYRAKAKIKKGTPGPKPRVKNRAKLRLETVEVEAPRHTDPKLMLFIGTVEQFKHLVGGM